MPLARTGDLVAAAAQRGAAVAAVNMITLEHAEAVVAAAERQGSAVVVQVSENAVRFHGGRPRPMIAAAAALAEAATVPVALHLDHVTDDELLHELAEPGPVSSVMVDASALPYAANVERTRAAARWAHARGLWVEAELGYVGGKADAPLSAHAAGVRTDPAEAAAYVAGTGVDALAVAVGSSHAMTARTASLDHDLVGRIATQVAVPLVLHGSSGVPWDDLAAAVAAGIRKVNVGTALNVAATRAIREVLGNDAAVVDPRRYLAPARDAMTDAVAGVLAVLNRDA